MPRWASLQGDGQQYGSTRNEVGWTTNKGTIVKIIPTEIFDKDGNVTAIEFYNELGTFEFQALWDPRDEQTNENREAFRKWSYRMAEQQKYEVLK